jgi:transcriptional regulator with XRE-family HTH domain
LILRADRRWSGGGEQIALDLRRLRLHAGLIDDAKACAVLGVTPKTLHRWERDNQAPAAVVRLLRLFCGELGALSPEWQGWRLAGDGIYPPGDSRGWVAGFVLALPYRNDQVRDQKRTIERLENERRNLSERLRLVLGWGCARERQNRGIFLTHEKSGGYYWRPPLRFQVEQGKNRLAARRRRHSRFRLAAGPDASTAHLGDPRWPTSLVGLSHTP